MSKIVKVRIINDVAKGFFERARQRARKLDRNEKLAAELTISFESATDMMRVLSPQRLRLLHAARTKPVPVSELASGLKRDTRAVTRDIDLLEQFGLIRSRYEVNPGHGKRRIVEPRAVQYQLVATI
jgi:predicted transcriptional regulator